MKKFFVRTTNEYEVTIEVDTVVKKDGKKSIRTDRYTLILDSCSAYKIAKAVEKKYGVNQYFIVQIVKRSTPFKIEDKVFFENAEPGEPTESIITCEDINESTIEGGEIDG